MSTRSELREKLKQIVRDSLRDKLKTSCKECQIDDFVEELPGESYDWKQDGEERRVYAPNPSKGTFVIQQFRCIEYRMALRTSPPMTGDGRDDDYVEFFLWMRVS